MVQEKPHRAVLSLGSNLGEREDTIERAVRELVSPEVVLECTSGLYVTDPVGGPQQPDYINAVIEVSTTLEPYELLGLCHRIEADYHRVRLIRWGPRTLDIDIIAYESEPGVQLVSSDPKLTLPHPRAHQRGFVLIPWLEANPRATLARATGSRAVSELVEQLRQRESDNAGVRYMRTMRL